jgi:hypothetical protein
MSPAKPFRRCPVLPGEVALDDTPRASAAARRKLRRTRGLLAFAIVPTDSGWQKRRAICRRCAILSRSLEIISQTSRAKPPLEFQTFMDMDALSAINEQPDRLSPPPKLELNIFVAPC